mmetsp:Transcript_14511/g.61303  ORF Transcript_14511/g.61303 Transcript_14511/m.61303 type:complete len:232 (-) Transcript_14511:1841-2536(-)
MGADVGRGADPPPGDRRRPRVRPRARHRPQGHQTRERAHRRRLGREARRFRPRRRRSSAARVAAGVHLPNGRRRGKGDGGTARAMPAGHRGRAVRRVPEAAHGGHGDVHGPGGSHASGAELPGGCLRVCDFNRGDDHRGGALRGSRAERRARAHGPGRELQRGGPRQGDRERGVEAVASRGGRGGVLWRFVGGERRRRRRRSKRVGAIRRDASRARRARLERGPERETHVR